MSGVMEREWNKLGVVKDWRGWRRVGIGDSEALKVLKAAHALERSRDSCTNEKRKARPSSNALTLLRLKRGMAQSDLWRAEWRAACAQDRRTQ